MKVVTDETTENPALQKRMAVYARLDEQKEQADNLAPSEVAEEVKDEVEESQIPTKEDKPEDQPPPPKMWAGKFKTPEEIEKAYEESEKTMRQEQSKAKDLEREFQRLRPYIDFSKIEREMQGKTAQPKELTDDELNEFFTTFAKKGPLVLEEQTQRAVKSIIPQITQAVQVQSDLKLARKQFLREYPDLKEFDEMVGKYVLEDVTQNPGKDIFDAMHDSAKRLNGILGTLKEKAKKEATSEFEIKKQDNLMSSEISSKDKVGTISSGKKKDEENEPQTLDEYVKMRRTRKKKLQDSSGYGKGYFNRR